MTCSVHCQYQYCFGCWAGVWRKMLELANDFWSLVGVLGDKCDKRRHFSYKIPSLFWWKQSFQLYLVNLNWDLFAEWIASGIHSGFWFTIIIFLNNAYYLKMLICVHSHSAVSQRQHLRFMVAFDIGFIDCITIVTQTILSWFPVTVYFHHCLLYFKSTVVVLHLYFICWWQVWDNLKQRFKAKWYHNI